MSRTIDSIQPPEYSLSGTKIPPVPVLPQEAAEFEHLPEYQTTVYQECLVNYKPELATPYLPAAHRNWTFVYLQLNNTQINIYTVVKAASHTPTVPIKTAAEPESRALGTFKNYSFPLREYENKTGTPLNASVCNGQYRVAKLLKSYTLQYADVGAASDYCKRAHVLRLRAEAQQFLLQLDSVMEYLAWADIIQATIDISLPLEERILSRTKWMSRRNRRNRNGRNQSTEVSEGRAITMGLTKIATQIRNCNIHRRFSQSPNNSNDDTIDRNKNNKASQATLHHTHSHTPTDPSSSSTTISRAPALSQPQGNTDIITPSIAQSSKLLKTLDSSDYHKKSRISRLVYKLNSKGQNDLQISNTNTKNIMPILSTSNSIGNTSSNSIGKVSNSLIEKTSNDSHFSTTENSQKAGDTVESVLDDDNKACSKTRQPENIHNLPITLQTSNDSFLKPVKSIPKSSSHLSNNSILSSTDSRGPGMILDNSMSHEANYATLFSDLNKFRNTEKTNVSISFDENGNNDDHEPNIVRILSASACSVSSKISSASQSSQTSRTSDISESFNMSDTSGTSMTSGEDSGSENTHEHENEDGNEHDKNGNENRNKSKNKNKFRSELNFEFESGMLCNNNLTEKKSETGSAEDIEDLGNRLRKTSLVSSANSIHSINSTRSVDSFATCLSSPESYEVPEISTLVHQEMDFNGYESSGTFGMVYENKKCFGNNGFENNFENDQHAPFQLAPSNLYSSKQATQEFNTLGMNAVSNEKLQLSCENSKSSKNENLDFLKNTTIGELENTTQLFGYYDNDKETNHNLPLMLPKSAVIHSSTTSTSNRVLANLLFQNSLERNTRQASSFFSPSAFTFANNYKHRQIHNGPSFNITTDNEYPSDQKWITTHPRESLKHALRCIKPLPAKAAWANKMVIVDNEKYIVLKDRLVKFSLVSE